MAIGDRAYRDLVPKEAREAVADQGLRELNRFSGGPDAQPYYPESVRSVFEKTVTVAGPVTPPSVQLVTR